MTKKIAKTGVADALKKFSKVFKEAMDDEADVSESYWTGLEPEEQLWAFCAMMRRLCKAELKEGRSYRGTLYDTFGWGPEAYAVAQMSGFLDLHNSIYKFEDLEHVFKATLKELEITVEDKELSAALAKHFY